MKLRTLVLIVGLFASSVLGVGFFARERWHNWQLRQQAFAMTVYAASLQATVDFDHGSLRKYEVSANNKIGYTGRHDGAFEIWCWPADSADQTSQQTAIQFVEMYNSKMKFMIAHPEDFPPPKAPATRSSTNP